MPKRLLIVAGRFATRSLRGLDFWVLGFTVSGFWGLGFRVLGLLV